MSAAILNTLPDVVSTQFGHAASAPLNAEKNNAREAASQNPWRRDTAKKSFMIIIRSAIELPHTRRRNRALSARRHGAARSAGSISVGPDATSRSDLLRDPRCACVRDDRLQLSTASVGKPVDILPDTSATH
jgi:hypothetical protein